MVDRITNSAVEYRVQRNDNLANALIVGYEVTRFGVPMIGVYVNAKTGQRMSITISPVVISAHYKITAWALFGAGKRRSATPAVKYITPGIESECGIYISSLYINWDRRELDWIKC